MKYYFVIMNILTFLAFFIDKRNAVRHQERISENTLLTLSFIGGAVGGLLAMHLFHHKTRKWKFKILMPLFVIGHVLFIRYGGF